jgi:CxxC-x17-CxxC domain-containing protein
MKKTCVNCRESFEVTSRDLEFYDDIAPTCAGTKFSIPPPKLCPPCRFQRRLAFRNERKLYHRTSDISGKEIICMFAPGNPYKVCDQDEWWSDEWDPMEYGQDFDFDRPFFDQLLELNLAVPHPSLNTQNVENSYYTNFSLNVRNSYLVYGVTDAEDCLYGKFVITAKDVLDSLSVYSCERCYEGIASQECYNCKYFLNCQNCSDCLMVEECMSCKNCMLCFGLRNKQYCYLNQEIGKEAYEQKRRELGRLTHGTIEQLQGEFAQLKAQLPHRSSHIFASEDCTGDMIFHSKGCHACFDIKNCEDCKFTAFTPNGVCSYDTAFTAPDGAQWCNHVLSTLGQRCMGTFMCWYTNDTYYSINCRNSDKLFGCVGLKKKKHCIFNKQYTEEEYERLMHKVIGHMVAADEWGRQLPVKLSHFAYNETIAHEYFPMQKEDVLKQGWSWRDEEDDVPDVEKVIPGSQLPQDINDIPDDILNWAIVCEVTGRPFRIIKQELQFYREMQLPVPRIHPDERHLRRLAKKNPYRLWKRQCANCGKTIQTNFSPDRPEIVYCEECYMGEVY